MGGTVFVGPRSVVEAVGGFVGEGTTIVGLVVGLGVGLGVGLRVGFVEGAGTGGGGVLSSSGIGTIKRSKFPKSFAP